MDRYLENRMRAIMILLKILRIKIKRILNWIVIKYLNKKEEHPENDLLFIITRIKRKEEKFILYDDINNLVHLKNCL